jgi:hypothetical protein
MGVFSGKVPSRPIIVATLEIFQFRLDRFCDPFGAPAHETRARLDPS